METKIGSWGLMSFAEIVLNILFVPIYLACVNYRMFTTKLERTIALLGMDIIVLNLSLLIAMFIIDSSGGMDLIGEAISRMEFTMSNIIFVFSWVVSYVIKRRNL